MSTEHTIQDQITLTLQKVGFNESAIEKAFADISEIAKLDAIYQIFTNLDPQKKQELHQSLEGLTEEQQQDKIADIILGLDDQEFDKIVFASTIQASKEYLHHLFNHITEEQRGQILEMA